MKTLSKIKNKFSNLKDSLKEKFFNLKLKIKGNKSLFYYLVSFFLVSGLLFFVSSKTLFDKGGEDIRSTAINDMQESNTLEAKILSRRYNPMNRLIEFIVYAEDEQNFDSKELIFQLREQSAPNVMLETRYQKIADSYYVVFAEAPKKWHVLSLSLGYESKLDSTLDYMNLENIDDIEELETQKEEKNNTLSSVIRIYNDVNDIEKNNFLKEKSSKEYFEEIIALEIQFIEEDLQTIDSKIAENVKIKEDADIKITELKQEQKYQTESEKTETDFSINKLQNLIYKKESQNENYFKLKEELQIKIGKLKEKKAIYEENGLY